MFFECSVVKSLLLVNTSLITLKIELMLNFVFQVRLLLFIAQIYLPLGNAHFRHQS